jgi:hypothetical protein
MNLVDYQCSIRQTYCSTYIETHNRSSLCRNDKKLTRRCVHLLSEGIGAANAGQRPKRLRAPPEKKTARRHDMPQVPAFFVPGQT